MCLGILREKYDVTCNDFVQNNQQLINMAANANLRSYLCIKSHIQSHSFQSIKPVNLSQAVVLWTFYRAEHVPALFEC